MAGLSIVLESHQKHVGCGFNKKSPQVINKVAMITNHHYKPSTSLSPRSPSPSPSSSATFPVPIFLQQCFLCKQTLLPGKDIYMYKGDRAFCSVECRCRQIFMDEEESLKKENCSLAAMKLKPTSASSSSSSTSASRHHHHHHHNNHRKGTRNRAGGFVY